MRRNKDNNAGYQENSPFQYCCQNYFNVNKIFLAMIQKSMTFELSAKIRFYL